MSRVQYLFRSRNIIPDTIKYIVREDKRSVIYFMDNQKISTSIPMKEIMTMLPEKDFVSIQKGVIVAVKQILDISTARPSRAESVISVNTRTGALLLHCM